MFASHTVLMMRGLPTPSALPFSCLQFRRRYHAASNVMEVKRYLSRCVGKSNSCPVPTLILVDAGERNLDIKSELDRWIEKHPRLRCVKVVFPRLGRWSRLSRFAAAFTKRWRSFLFSALAPQRRADDSPQMVEAHLVQRTGNTRFTNIREVL